jgi:hypothetical protein
VKFQYEPSIVKLIEQFNLPPEVKFNVIALFVKRDRELEDYISDLEARIVALEP